MRPSEGDKSYKGQDENIKKYSVEGQEKNLRMAYSLALI